MRRGAGRDPRGSKWPITLVSSSGRPRLESVKVRVSTLPPSATISGSSQARMVPCAAAPGTRGPASTWCRTRASARPPSAAGGAPPAAPARAPAGSGAPRTPAQAHGAAHRGLLAENVDLLPLAVGARQAEAQVGIARGLERVAERVILVLGDAALDLEIGAGAVLELARQAEQRPPVAAGRDRRGPLAVVEVVHGAGPVVGGAQLRLAGEAAETQGVGDQAVVELQVGGGRGGAPAGDPAGRGARGVEAVPHAH